MNAIVTTGIILSRTDFGEADRIITMLTPEHGKVRLMAKGVRRVKSKLAGGIELFSISKISFIRGRGEIGTLVSSQLDVYYRHIVTDIDRTMLGYELIKLLDKITEDEPEAEYFDLLEHAFAALDDVQIPLLLVRLWFSMRLLRLGGNTPNLHTDTAGNKLDPSLVYTFDYDAMAFVPRTNGLFTADDIKFLRLGFSGNTPAVLAKVGGVAELVERASPLVVTLLNTYVRH
jgi:DNA repair protein RecO (recombination protein O)